jgi:2-keto-4-pentenoate hydratase/2-oxohepta-3-ene-1,7-dioic acid hydratase in catechol pathway
MTTIFCLGRNYAAHAREMGAVADAEAESVVFLKPEGALLAPPGPIRFPPGAGEIHHEAEIVVRVGPDGGAEAVALGLDLTDRTRQAAAKAAGLPWARAKGFRGSACVGPFVPAARVPLDRLRFLLEVNGALRQSGNAGDMLRPIPRILQELEAWFGLAPGDLVFTGTPEGVAPLRPGDRLTLRSPDEPGLHAQFVVAGATG